MLNLLEVRLGIVYSIFVLNLWGKTCCLHRYYSITEDMDFSYCNAFQEMIDHYFHNRLMKIKYNVILLKK